MLTAGGRAGTTGRNAVRLAGEGYKNGSEPVPTLLPRGRTERTVMALKRRPEPVMTDPVYDPAAGKNAVMAVWTSIS